MLSWKASLAESDLRDHWFWAVLAFLPGGCSCWSSHLWRKWNAFAKANGQLRILTHQHWFLPSYRFLIAACQVFIRCWAMCLLQGKAQVETKGVFLPGPSFGSWGDLRFQEVMWFTWSDRVTPRGQKPASVPHHKPIAKMVSSPGLIYITILVSHLVYLTMAGKEKETKGKKKKKEGGERFFFPLVFFYWFDIEKTDRPLSQ